MTLSLYELKSPTKWSTAPEQFSFSNLQTIESCPRRWQLLHSSWGDHSRFPERPHPAALEGSIVHKAIELLIQALGHRGLPRIGSNLFREAIEEVDFWGYFDRLAYGLSAFRWFSLSSLLLCRFCWAFARAYFA